MASQAGGSTAPKKIGMGRGPNTIPKAPANLDDRTLIQIRHGPNSPDFADPRIVKCISQMCIQNWPTPAITWATTPAAHKDAVWAEFTKRYRWADEDAALISTLFWQKCAARTKDKFSKDRQKALNNAGVDYPGQGVLHMHEYGPWWCSADIWTQMCEQWRDEKWVQKRYTAANNRSAGAPVGEKAKGTYRGGSISQLQHIANKESECEGTRINWLDVYMSTRDGLPDAQKIADDYRRLLDERYPEGTERPEIDQELWERASIVKKNYIKGQGQRRRSSFSGSFSGSGSTQSSQSSSHPPTHTPADYVRAICRDRELLRILGGHLGALDPDELARAVAEAASSSQQDDGSQGSHHGAGDGESGGS
ncbi:hypothetical protein POM88_009011 [Heracleum sosnowskyi]|uniref:Uncharacterized protein n=1 Tax=Heracleum sosnowskyi TaxID=360622 RepID=A0AAD8J9U7_9APIA|nr:hypothetical protein POM88_009011 [Heracleum sosnowskyi]